MNEQDMTGQDGAAAGGSGELSEQALDAAQGGTTTDSLSEMGEMESMRMQMAMDRQSKAMSTLSNIMKKMSSTASAITNNIK